MSWMIKGEFIESCSCNMLCPCWYGVKELMIMDQGWCGSPWLIRISEGESEGVDLNGCNVLLSMFFPGPTVLDGEGTGRLYLDTQTSDEQRRELEAIFLGQKGGPKTGGRQKGTRNKVSIADLRQQLREAEYDRDWARHRLEALRRTGAEFVRLLEG